MEEPFNSRYKSLTFIRAEMLVEATSQDKLTLEDADEMKGEYLREWARRIEDVFLEVETEAGEVAELKEQNDNLEAEKEALENPELWGDSKLAIVHDLINNCTEQELEALEMIMRRQKKNYYAKRANLPHADNVDLNLIYGDLL